MLRRQLRRHTISPCISWVNQTALFTYSPLLSFLLFVASGSTDPDSHPD